MDWRPNAPLETLAERARLLAAIRAFFAERGALEADVPALCAAGAQEPQLQSIACATASGARYLHPSPEFGLKRLLAAGCGDVYQLAHVYRDGERGRWHNPEFTMLEWYRRGWDEFALMAEVGALLVTLGAPAPERAEFTTVFGETVGIGADAASGALREHATARGFAPAAALPDDAAPGARAFWLELLVGLAMTPALGQRSPCLVHGWPPALAGLTRLRPGPAPVAARFELIWQGVELANGGWELTDAAELARRFEDERSLRQVPGPPVDARLLAALRNGLPDCAGVALGVDRLLALLHGAGSLDAVLPFTDERA